MVNFESWGRLSHSKHTNFLNLNSKKSLQPLDTRQNILPIGCGRSYGDEAYNDNGTLISSRSLNKFISFDRGSGILTAECGVTLSEILALIVPAKWFLPATPGTKFVTLAGAIANDVHGKNHHKDGSFGCFVEEFGLIRSNGEYLECSREQNAPIFFATIGGMGLTGIITWARIRLLKIASNSLITSSFRFKNLEEYFKLNSELENSHQYTVAWVDCLAKGDNLGRGVFFTGNHGNEDIGIKKKRTLNIPFTPPFSLVNQLSLKAFNSLYYAKNCSTANQTTYYEPFFYPLDKINNWNRLYGKRGFYQYQSVVPTACGYDATHEMLKAISDSGIGSFLAVLKTFGDKSSGGLMSFPRPGITLALDFPNLGAKTAKLFAKLDRIVTEADGAIYPAKDARMPRELFVSGYPNLTEFTNFKDPLINSNMWQRLVQKGH